MTVTEMQSQTPYQTDRQDWWKWWDSQTPVYRAQWEREHEDNENARADREIARYMHTYLGV